MQSSAHAATPCEQGKASLSFRWKPEVKPLQHWPHDGHRCSSAPIGMQQCELRKCITKLCALSYLPGPLRYVPMHWDPLMTPVLALAA